MMILIAGPYRSGTDNDARLVEKNLRELEAPTLEIFRKGHIPVIAEWIANPLMKLAGSTEIGDSIFNEMQYPLAHRLLSKCDAVLRIKGESQGADQDVDIALNKGLKVFYSLKEIPHVK